MRRQRYLLWNKREDFEAGRGQGTICTKDGLFLPASCTEGCYATAFRDSGREGMEWDRLFLEGSIPYPEDVEITLYTGDKTNFQWYGQEWKLEDIIRDASHTLKEKETVWAACRRRVFPYRRRQLLYGITGRYLWLVFRFRNRGGAECLITRIQAFFPKVSWMDYLPECYRNGKESVLERYLAVFSTMHETMDERIRAIPADYEPAVSSGERLLRTAQWLSLENVYLWKEEQLRYLLCHAMELYDIRGTAAYMKQMIRLFTGREAYIVEYWQWAEAKIDGRRRVLLENLYGRDGFCVTVLLEQEAVPDSDRLAAMDELLAGSAPAHIDVRLILLKPCIFLDRYTYLGINSRLGGFGQSVLDGRSALPCVIGRRKTVNEQT